MLGRTGSTILQSKKNKTLIMWCTYDISYFWEGYTKFRGLFPQPPLFVPMVVDNIGQ